MPTKFEQSEFGYWIAPDGAVHPLPQLQAHAAELRRLLGEPETSLPDHALRQWAIDSGWATVTIDPLSGSPALHCRERGLDRRVVSAFIRVVSAHNWRAVAVATEFPVTDDSGGARTFATGQQVYLYLRARSRDLIQFPDPLDEVAHYKSRCEALEGELALLRRTAKAATEGGGLDAAVLENALSGIEHSSKRIDANVDRFFAAAEKLSTAKEAVDVAHYYVGHEVSRYTWYVRHLLGDVRRAVAPARPTATTEVES